MELTNGLFSDIVADDFLKGIPSSVFFGLWSIEMHISIMIRLMAQLWFIWWKYRMIDGEQILIKLNILLTNDLLCIPQQLNDEHLINSSCPYIFNFHLNRERFDPTSPMETAIRYSIVKRPQINTPCLNLTETLPPKRSGIRFTDLLYGRNLRRIYNTLIESIYQSLNKRNRYCDLNIYCNGYEGTSTQITQRLLYDTTTRESSLTMYRNTLTDKKMTDSDEEKDTILENLKNFEFYKYTEYFQMQQKCLVQYRADANLDTKKLITKAIKRTFERMFGKQKMTLVVKLLRQQTKSKHIRKMGNQQIGKPGNISFPENEFKMEFQIILESDVQVFSNVMGPAVYNIYNRFGFNALSNLLFILLTVITIVVTICLIIYLCLKSKKKDVRGVPQNRWTSVKNKFKIFQTKKKREHPRLSKVSSASYYNPLTDTYFSAHLFH
ncbi:hypothetical protein SNEBB_002265 [Seison nebaliae]|nr:hypothetical protein SNEBB_002265 [Seison nebaliae]